MRFLVEQLFFLLSVLAQVCSLPCEAPLVLDVPRSYTTTRESDDDREARGSVAGVKVVAWVPTRSFSSFRVASKVAVAVAQLVRSARDLRRAAVPQRRRVASLVALMPHRQLRGSQGTCCRVYSINASPIDVSVFPRRDFGAHWCRTANYRRS